MSSKSIANSNKTTRSGLPKTISKTQVKPSINGTTIKSNSVVPTSNRQNKKEGERLELSTSKLLSTTERPEAETTDKLECASDTVIQTRDKKDGRKFIAPVQNTNFRNLSRPTEASLLKVKKLTSSSIVKTSSDESAHSSPSTKSTSGAISKQLSSKNKTKVISRSSTPNSVTSVDLKSSTSLQGKNSEVNRHGPLISNSTNGHQNDLKLHAIHNGKASEKCSQIMQQFRKPDMKSKPKIIAKSGISQKASKPKFSEINGKSSPSCTPSSVENENSSRSCTPSSVVNGKSSRSCTLSSVVNGKSSRSCTPNSVVNEKSSRSCTPSSVVNGKSSRSCTPNSVVNEKSSRSYTSSSVVNGKSSRSSTPNSVVSRSSTPCSVTSSTTESRSSSSTSSDTQRLCIKTNLSKQNKTKSINSSERKNKNILQPEKLYSTEQASVKNSTKQSKQSSSSGQSTNTGKSSSCLDNSTKFPSEEGKHSSNEKPDLKLISASESQRQENLYKSKKSSLISHQNSPKGTANNTICTGPINCSGTVEMAVAIDSNPKTDSKGPSKLNGQNKLRLPKIKRTPNANVIGHKGKKQSIRTVPSASSQNTMTVSNKAESSRFKPKPLTKDQRVNCDNLREIENEVSSCKSKPASKCDVSKSMRTSCTSRLEASKDVRKFICERAEVESDRKPRSSESAANVKSASKKIKQECVLSDMCDPVKSDNASESRANSPTVKLNINHAANSVTDRLSKDPKSKTRTNVGKGDNDIQLMSSLAIEKQIYSFAEQKRNKVKIDKMKIKSTCTDHPKNTSQNVGCSTSPDNRNIRVENNELCVKRNSKGLKEICRTKKTSQEHQLSAPLHLSTKEQKTSDSESVKFPDKKTTAEKENVCFSCQMHLQHCCTHELHPEVKSSNLSADLSNLRNFGNALLTKKDASAYADAPSTSDVYSEKCHSNRKRNTNNSTSTSEIPYVIIKDNMEKNSAIFIEGTSLSNAYDSSFVHEAKSQYIIPSDGFTDSGNQTYFSTISRSAQGINADIHRTNLEPPKQAKINNVHAYEQLLDNKDKQGSLPVTSLPCNVIPGVSQVIPGAQLKYCKDFEIKTNSVQMNNRTILSQANCISCKCFPDKCYCTVKRGENEISVSKADKNLAVNRLSVTCVDEFPEENLSSTAITWKIENIKHFEETNEMDGIIPGDRETLRVTSENKISNKKQGDLFCDNDSNAKYTQISTDMAELCDTSDSNKAIKMSQQDESTKWKNQDKEITRHATDAFEQLSGRDLDERYICDKSEISDSVLHNFLREKHFIEKDSVVEYIDPEEECCVYTVLPEPTKQISVMDKNFLIGKSVKPSSVENATTVVCDTAYLETFVDPVCINRELYHIKESDKQEPRQEQFQCQLLSENCDKVSGSCAKASADGYTIENTFLSSVKAISMDIIESNLCVPHEVCTELESPLPDQALVKECLQTCETQVMCQTCDLLDVRENNEEQVGETFINVFCKSDYSTKTDHSPSENETSEPLQFQNDTRQQTYEQTESNTIKHQHGRNMTELYSDQPSFITQGSYDGLSKDMNFSIKGQNMHSHSKSTSIPCLSYSHVLQKMKRSNSDSSIGQVNKTGCSTCHGMNISAATRNYSCNPTQNELCKSCTQHQQINLLNIEVCTVGLQDTKNNCACINTNKSMSSGAKASFSDKLCDSLPSSHGLELYPPIENYSRFGENQIYTSKKDSSIEPEAYTQSSCEVVETTQISSRLGSNMLDVLDKSNRCAYNYSQEGSVVESEHDLRNISAQVENNENGNSIPKIGIYDNTTSHQADIFQDAHALDLLNFDKSSKRKAITLSQTDNNKESGYFSNEQSQESVQFNYDKIPNSLSYNMSDKFDMLPSQTLSPEFCVSQQTDDAINENEVKKCQNDHCLIMQQTTKALSTEFDDKAEYYSVIPSIKTTDETCPFCKNKSMNNFHRDDVSNYSSICQKCTSQLSETKNSVVESAWNENDKNHIFQSRTNEIVSFNSSGVALQPEQAICGQYNQIKVDTTALNLKEASNFIDKKESLSFTHGIHRSQESLTDLHTSEKCNTHGQCIILNNLLNSSGGIYVHYPYGNQMLDFSSEKNITEEISCSKAPLQTSKVCHNSSPNIHETTDENTSHVRRSDLISKENFESKQKPNVAESDFSQQKCNGYSLQHCYLKDNAFSISSGRNWETFFASSLDLPENTTSVSDVKDVKSYLTNRSGTDTCVNFTKTPPDIGSEGESQINRCYSDIFENKRTEYDTVDSQCDKASLQTNINIYQDINKINGNSYQRENFHSNPVISNSTDYGDDDYLKNGTSFSSVEKHDLQPSTKHTTVRNENDLQDRHICDNAYLAESSSFTSSVIEQYNNKAPGYVHSGEEKKYVPSEICKSLFETGKKCCSNICGQITNKVQNAIVSQGGESLCDIHFDDDVYLSETCDNFVDAEDSLFDSETESQSKDDSSCLKRNRNSGLYNGSEASTSVDSFKDAIESIDENEYDDDNEIACHSLNVLKAETNSATKREIFYSYNLDEFYLYPCIVCQSEPCSCMQGKIPKLKLLAWKSLLFSNTIRDCMNDEVLAVNCNPSQLFKQENINFFSRQNGETTSNLSSCSNIESFEKSENTCSSDNPYLNTISSNSPQKHTYKCRSLDRFSESDLRINKNKFVSSKSLEDLQLLHEKESICVSDTSKYYPFHCSSMSGKHETTDAITDHQSSKVAQKEVIQNRPGLRISRNQAKTRYEEIMNEKGKNSNRSSSINTRQKNNSRVLNSINILESKVTAEKQAASIAAIGNKIETALTIRNEKRRLRQIHKQPTVTASDHNFVPNVSVDSSTQSCGTVQAATSVVSEGDCIENENSKLLSTDKSETSQSGNSLIKHIPSQQDKSDHIQNFQAVSQAKFSGCSSFDTEYKASIQINISETSHIGSKMSSNTMTRNYVENDNQIFSKPENDRILRTDLKVNLHSNTLHEAFSEPLSPTSGNELCSVSKNDVSSHSQNKFHDIVQNNICKAKNTELPEYSKVDTCGDVEHDCQFPQNKSQCMLVIDNDIFSAKPNLSLPDIDKDEFSEICRQESIENSAVRLSRFDEKTFSETSIDQMSRDSFPVICYTNRYSISDTQDQMTKQIKPAECQNNDIQLKTQHSSDIVQERLYKDTKQNDSNFTAAKNSEVECLVPSYTDNCKRLSISSPVSLHVDILQTAIPLTESQKVSDTVDRPVSGVDPLEYTEVLSHLLSQPNDTCKTTTSEPEKLSVLIDPDASVLSQDSGKTIVFQTSFPLHQIQSESNVHESSRLRADCLKTTVGTRENFEAGAYISPISYTRQISESEITEMGSSIPSASVSESNCQSDLSAGVSENHKNQQQTPITINSCETSISDLHDFPQKYICESTNSYDCKILTDQKDNSSFSDLNEGCQPTENVDSEMLSAKINQNKELIHTISENILVICSQNQDTDLCSQTLSVSKDNAGESLQLNENCLSTSKHRLSNKTYTELHYDLNSQDVNGDSKILIYDDGRHEVSNIKNVDYSDSKDIKSTPQESQLSLIQTTSNALPQEESIVSQNEITHCDYGDQDILFVADVVDSNIENVAQNRIASELQVTQIDDVLDSEGERKILTSEANENVSSFEIDDSGKIKGSTDNQTNDTSVTCTVAIDNSSSIIKEFVLELSTTSAEQNDGYSETPKTVKQSDSILENLRQIHDILKSEENVLIINKNSSSVNLESHVSENIEYRTSVSDQLPHSYSTDDSSKDVLNIKTEDTCLKSNHLQNQTDNQASESLSYIPAVSNKGDAVQHSENEIDRQSEMRQISHIQDIPAANSTTNDTEICEDPNISVALALRREKEKLNELKSFPADIRYGNRGFRRATTAVILRNRERKFQSESLSTDTESSLSNSVFKKSNTFPVEKLSNTAENISTVKDNSQTEDFDNTVINKKVADICKTFIAKTQASIADKTALQKFSPAVSPLPQRKLMNWVCKEGKWKREPMPEATDSEYLKRDPCVKTASVKDENANYESNEKQHQSHHNQQISAQCDCSSEYESLHSDKNTKDKVTSVPKLNVTSLSADGFEDSLRQNIEYKSNDQKPNMHAQNIDRSTNENPVSDLDITTPDAVVPKKQAAIHSSSNLPSAKECTNRHINDDILLLFAGDDIEYMDGVNPAEIDAEDICVDINGIKPETNTRQENDFFTNATAQGESETKLISYTQCAPNQLSFDKSRAILGTVSSMQKAMHNTTGSFLEHDGLHKKICDVDIVARPVSSIPELPVKPAQLFQPFSLTDCCKLSLSNHSSRETLIHAYKHIESLISEQNVSGPDTSLLPMSHHLGRNDIKTDSDKTESMGQDDESNIPESKTYLQEGTIKEDKATSAFVQLDSDGKATERNGDEATSFVRTNQSIRKNDGDKSTGNSHSSSDQVNNSYRLKKKPYIPLPSKQSCQFDEQNTKSQVNVLTDTTAIKQDAIVEIAKPDKNIPQRIPKLKAVKIKEEEIYEGKPEYTKECNLNPLGIESDDLANKSNKLIEQVQKVEENSCDSQSCISPGHLESSNTEPVLVRTPLNKLIKRSKTFSALGDIQSRYEKNKTTFLEHALKVRSSQKVPNQSACKIPALKSKSEQKEPELKDEICYKPATEPRMSVYDTECRSTQKLTRTYSLPDNQLLFDSTIDNRKTSNFTGKQFKYGLDGVSKVNVTKNQVPDNKDNGEKKPGRRVERSKSLQRPKLLSEIAEVEESRDDLQTQGNKGPGTSHSGPTLEPRLKRPVVRRTNKRRSLSLPTGTLAFGEARIVYKNGHFTIETMDGTELESTGLTSQQSCYSGNQEQSVNQKPSYNRGHQTQPRMLPEPHSGLQREITAERPQLRRQVGKTVLNKNRLLENGEVCESNIENVSPNKKHYIIQQNKPLPKMCSSDESGVSVLSQNKAEHSFNETAENILVGKQMEFDHETESLGEMPLHHQSSSSLPEAANEDAKLVAQRARRTPSFRQAQEQGAYRLSGIQEDKDHEISRRRTVSLDESQNTDLNQSRVSQNTNQNASFFQRMMAKRKSSTENLNLSGFAKQSESAKDFFAKKMSLKGLFRKNRSDSSVSSPLKTQLSSSPPVTVFNRYEDRDSVGSAPSSPFTKKDMRRRHTSADLFSQAFKDATPSSEPNSYCNTPTKDKIPVYRSNSVTHGIESSYIVRRDNLSPRKASSSCSVSKLSPSAIDEDDISIKSNSSTTGSIHSVQSQTLEQPDKPKTPKPIGTSPRRIPSGSSQSSRIFSYRDRDTTMSVTSLESETSEIVFEEDDDLKCDCENLTPTLARAHKYSATQETPTFQQRCELCGKYTAEFHNDPGKVRKFMIGSEAMETPGRLPKDPSGRLALLVQTEISASNSNDSGIQHDVSVHSSSESLKGTPESKVRLRRQKSSSPRPERPKSEVGVRWADLATQEYDIISTPIRRRERSQNIKDRPRPKSDFENNIQLFDELFIEVLEDFETDGSSFFSDRMKAFGSEINLQPYCSLRNLYEMRRRDWENNQGKNRRMSTPHPIKSRLQRSPKRLQKQAPLVRSSSMPESLDKVHKRRKLHHLLDFHEASLSKHMDIDECLSDDSDLSFDHISLQEKSLSVQSSQSQLTSMDEEEDNLTFAEALWDHITMDPEELGFRAGDLINVFDMSDKDWWFGEIEDREGWFPAAFVRLRVNQDQLEDELEVTLQAELSTSPKLRRISTLNKDQARSNVVNEIISAEREYVKHLKDVVEGYIQHARKRREMFSEERLALIFGNIENIYAFAQKFLSQLEMCIDVCPHLSEIGQCFLDYEKGFEIYSDYCNNHPSASEELKELYRNAKYRHFFEACRLLQELVEIPLEGFLLTPVQKICKYPLQLAELLKYTPPEHADYLKVKAALYEMRKIATLINERKRKMESIEKIAAWQHTVADWEGEDLLEKSSELIFSGDINKINSAGWSQERYFFLFDHQLIYCKKEILKRHVFSYKGRIDLDHCDIIPVPDGKDAQYNVTVKHGWKLHETHRDKWYLLYTKTDTVKDRWLKALGDERKRVREDQENDFCVPEHWKQTVLNKVRSQSTLKEKQHSHRPAPDSHHMLQKDLTAVPYATLPRTRRPTSQKQEKKKGWFNFGGKKSKR